MHRFLSTTHRSIVWFKKVSESGELIISPPYQRNPVWSERQQAALIVTMLLEYPIPEVYMQETTTAEGQQKHILVDGQQRIRAALGFLYGDFELDDDSERWSGLSFEDLAAEDRKKIFEYNFVVRLLPEMPDEEVRGIFQRINRNTTVLNNQELRRATYWGPFISLMEDLSNIEFWNEAGIFSANDRRRMLDVEYVSELTVAVLNGLQNKKKMLEDFYQQYETQFEDQDRVRNIFYVTLGEIRQCLPNLNKTRWKKKSDFYTLFLEMAKHVGAFPLSSEMRAEVSRTLEAFASDVDFMLRKGSDMDDHPHASVIAYVANVEKAASDLGSRRGRAEALNTLLCPVLTTDSASADQAVPMPALLPLT